MGTKYYTDLYEIEDPFRQKKYLQLLISSLENDMFKWTENITGAKTRYISPDYNGSYFAIEIGQYANISYVRHMGTKPINGRDAELITENFPKELNTLVSAMRQKVFTPEIYEIEKLVGKQHSRKEKLDNLENEQVKEIVDDTYKDYIENQNEVTAEMVAKIMYAYRKKESIYNLWLEKFKDVELVMDEYKKLKG